ncbi:superoxide dismutase family protein [Pedobacter yonginense]|nr:superoxide dismutase family protein [Pedobacter yonginense]
MKNYLLGLAIASMAIVSACTSKADKEIATATLNETADNTKTIGTAKFYQQSDGKVKLELNIDFPSKADSTVAVHLHEHGDCGDMGMNTHGHWNPTKENHGKWGSSAYHSGDIGNIQLDGKGKGSVTVATDRWNITSGDSNSIVGRGIIVHGGTDDYTTQPTGNSGPRVGCGIIEIVK